MKIRLASHNFKKTDVYGSIKKTGLFICKCLLLFFLIYNMPTPISFLNSERIVVFLGLVYVISRGKICISREPISNRYFVRFLTLLACMTLYSIMILTVNGGFTGSTFAHDAIRFLIIDGFAYLIIINTVESLDEFMRLLLWVTVVQCGFILAGILSPEFADYMDHVLNMPEVKNFDFAYYRTINYPSGLACVAAPGVLKLVFGMIACTYFIQQKKHVTFYTLLFLFIALVSTAVARTAMILAAICLGAAVLSAPPGEKRKVLIPVIFAVLLACAYIYASGLYKIMGKIYGRVIYLFKHGVYDSFLGGYGFNSDDIIPPLTLDTLIGTGVNAGISYSSGVHIHADGEFFGSYAALGLPLAVFYYFMIYFLMLKSTMKVSSRSIRYVCYTFMACLAVGQFKESYTLLGHLMLFFFLFIGYALKEQKKGSNKETEEYEIYSKV